MSNLTSWLLPFIALMSQLPMEGSSPWYDLLSVCLAIGSPALAAYSLALTALNRAHVARRFALLKERSLEDTTSHLSQIIDSVSFVVTELYQVPIRASNQDSWLNSLLFLPENIGFWKLLEKDLRSSSRGFTYTFFAQGQPEFCASH